MAEILPPSPVKFFIAILFANESSLQNVLSLLQKEWGRIDIQSASLHFDVTDYYESEMGSPLFRTIIAFEKIMPPTYLVAMKIRCNEIENALSNGNKRTVNLDVGYLDHNKTVLASAKEAGQKIYLDRGIYADLAGRYRAGKYHPFEWSFPDFRDGRYDSYFLDLRAIFLKQLKLWRKSSM